MPARTETTPEFKDQAVKFVLEEIEPNQGLATTAPGEVP